MPDWRSTLAALTTCVLLLTCAACASSDARIAKAQKRTNQTIAVLAQMTDADSLALPQNVDI